MRQVPSGCSSCGEPNIHHLDYCVVCGNKFKSVGAGPSEPKKKNPSTRDRKINAKRMKKRKELTNLFKKKKISAEQYASGIRKLGYSTNVDKALAFKKYIQSQIDTMEKMDVNPNTREGDVYYDPNQARIDLPRDAKGNVIVDFTTGSDGTQERKKPTESMPIVDHSAVQTNENGPRFGESLFGDRSGGKRKNIEEKKTRKVVIGISEEKKRVRKGPRRKRALADWDDEEEQEDFSIDLSNEEKGESGWWDDDDWELDWTEDDEEEYKEWKIEFEDEEEDDWILEFDEDGDEHGYDVEFEEDDEGHDSDTEEEDDWVPSRRKRGKQNR